MAGTLCASGSAIIKAGANVGAVPAASWDVFIEEAEALIYAVTRYDWVTNYATVKTKFKPLLSQICSDIAGINGIAYDMSGYTSRIEGEDVINVLRDAALRGLSLLRDQKAVDFIK